MEETIAFFKRTLRKFNYKRVEQRLEELSETPLDLEEVMQVVDNPVMCREFQEVIDKIKSEEKVEPRKLKLRHNGHCKYSISLCQSTSE